jgi:hypothetical protein
MACLLIILVVVILVVLLAVSEKSLSSKRGTDILDPFVDFGEFRWFGCIYGTL